MSTTIPIWPKSLPQSPLASSFKQKAPSNLLRSSMDTGPDKVRRRGTAKPFTQSLTFVMDNTQLNTFENFVRNTLGYGVRAFEMYQTHRERYVRTRIVPSSETLYTISYVTRDEAEPVWEVSFDIEFFPQITPSNGV